MDVSSFFLSAFNAIRFSSILFFISFGLTITLGMMGFFNFAHGAFVMTGGYMGYFFVQTLGNFWFALLIVPIVFFFVGLSLERSLFRYLSEESIYQLIASFGLIYLLQESMFGIFGGRSKVMDFPGALKGHIVFFKAGIPLYNIFLILLFVIIAIVLYFFFTRTNYGRIINSMTYNKNIAKLMGYNISKFKMVFFGIGVAFAGFSGVLAGPILSLSPWMWLEIILLSLVVVIIGGMGSYTGALIASIFIGMIYSLGITLVGKYYILIVYAVLIPFLLFRPRGIKGRKGLFE